MKRSIFTILLACTFIICFATVGHISGKWVNIMTNYDGSKERVVYTFKVNGGHITGNLAYRVGKFMISSGSVKGDSIHFEVQFHEHWVAYKGKIYPDSIALDVDDDHIYHIRLIRAHK